VYRRICCSATRRSASLRSAGTSGNSDRGLIQVGVNAAGSSKKETLRNVRVSTRSGPVRPGSSYNAYQFELRDRCCVSLIIPPKSRLAEINDFGTQV